MRSAAASATGSTRSACRFPTTSGPSASGRRCHVHGGGDDLQEGDSTSTIPADARLASDDYLLTPWVRSTASSSRQRSLTVGSRSERPDAPRRARTCFAPRPSPARMMLLTTIVSQALASPAARRSATASMVATAASHCRSSIRREISPRTRWRGDGGGGTKKGCGCFLDFMHPTYRPSRRSGCVRPRGKMRRPGAGGGASRPEFAPLREPIKSASCSSSATSTVTRRYVQA